MRAQKQFRRCSCCPCLARAAADRVLPTLKFQWQILRISKFRKREEPPHTWPPPSASLQQARPPCSRHACHQRSAHVHGSQHHWKQWTRRYRQVPCLGTGLSTASDATVHSAAEAAPFQKYLLKKRQKACRSGQTTEKMPGQSAAVHQPAAESSVCEGTTNHQPEFIATCGFPSMAMVPPSRFQQLT